MRLLSSSCQRQVAEIKLLRWRRRVLPRVCPQSASRFSAIVLRRALYSTCRSALLTEKCGRDRQRSPNAPRSSGHVLRPARIAFFDRWGCRDALRGSGNNRTRFALGFLAAGLEKDARAFSSEVDTGSRDKREAFARRKRVKTKIQSSDPIGTEKLWQRSDLRRLMNVKFVKASARNRTNFAFSTPASEITAGVCSRTRAIREVEVHESSRLG